MCCEIYFPLFLCLLYIYSSEASSTMKFLVFLLRAYTGRGPRLVVSTAAFHVRVRSSFPGFGGLKETKMFLPQPLVKLSIVGILRDREVECSASHCQCSNFESCVWRAVSSHLTIFMRFSWPNLAYMRTQVA